MACYACRNTRATPCCHVAALYVVLAEPSNVDASSLGDVAEYYTEPEDLFFEYTRKCGETPVNTSGVAQEICANIQSDLCQQARCTEEKEVK